MADYKTIQLIIDDEGIALVTFDRPAVRNALNHEMVQELEDVLSTLSLREDLTALVFTGSEKAFVSGADISELVSRNRWDALRRINTGLFRRIESFPAPTIAAIRGYALGGGCELSMACDIRIAGQGAKLGQPEVALGILPGAGGTYRLAKLVGLGMARELVFTGRIISGEEAHRIGLVNRVVPDGEVVDCAIELAREIGKNSILAVRFSKLSLNSALEMSTDVAMLVESTAQAVLFEAPDKEERMTAFLERKARRQQEKEQG